MRFVDEHRDRHAVALLLRVLGIEESTYYGWVKRAAEPCERDLVDRGLLSNIHEIWTGSGRSYGADRMWRQLRRDGVPVGRKRVERLMREQGWQGAFVRRGWRRNSTVQDPRATPAPDRVNRQFTAAAPNRLWVADATRIPCAEGTFWLAAVRDAFSNRIVGWRCSDRCDTDLILGALEYGIWTRDVRDGQLIHHSDKGSNYTSFRFSQRLSDNGILASWDRPGTATTVDGELLVHPEDRVGVPHLMAHPRRGRERDLRLHRRLVQHPTHPGRPRRPQPGRVRDRLARR
jgi:transposase InsO family protein